MTGNQRVPNIRPFKTKNRINRANRLMVCAIGGVGADQTVAENRLIRVTGVGWISATPTTQTATGSQDRQRTTTKYLVDTNTPPAMPSGGGIDASDTVQVVYTYGLDLISQNRHRIAGLWDKSYYGYDGTEAFVTDRFDRHGDGQLRL
jgi:hypothetical protein